MAIEKKTEAVKLWLDETLELELRRLPRAMIGS
jgi:hypothetical protein